ncbi:MAG: NUDIX domain-containing protein [Clostridia bacterium]|jgi:8-oxo-dGTP diphosphatase|nr:NUDIX domain-containing protein [Clostridia bacterium]HJJ09785.1 NUDIX domain-containing protein [Clostridiaceae bacterium]
MKNIEKRDLYDINRVLTGKTIFKGDSIPDNNYIVVVLVFIQNSDGKFLIQKRSKIKNGKYATTGGHPKSGENSIQGIISEVKEEIGLDINSKDLKLYYSGRSDSEKVFWDDYYIKMDVPNIQNLSLQKEEVESVCWLSIDEINSLMNGDKFFKNHYEEFEILLNWLKEVEKTCYTK